MLERADEAAGVDDDIGYRLVGRDDDVVDLSDTLGLGLVVVDRTAEHLTPGAPPGRDRPQFRRGNADERRSSRLGLGDRGRRKRHTREQKDCGGFHAFLRQLALFVSPPGCRCELSFLNPDKSLPLCIRSKRHEQLRLPGLTHPEELGAQCFIPHAGRKNTAAVFSAQRFLKGGAGRPALLSLFTPASPPRPRGRRHSG